MTSVMMGYPVQMDGSRMRVHQNIQTGPAFPAPLSEEGLLASMRELPEGTRRAAEACCKCFKERKFTSADLLSFIRSISSQSPTLTKIMRENVGQAIPAKRTVITTTTKTVQVAKPAPVQEAVQAFHTYDISRGIMPARAIVRVDMVEHLDTKFEKSEQAVDMTTKLIERRRREIRRRQLSAFPGGNGEKRSRYMSSVIRRLSQKIPEAGKRIMHDAIKNYLAHQTTPEQLVESLQMLVDEYGCIVPLQYTPECETRAPSIPGVHSNKRASSSQAGGSRKRGKVEAAINIHSCPSTPPSSTNTSSPAQQTTEYLPQAAQASNSPHHRGVPHYNETQQHMPKPEGPVSSSELVDTPLGDFLTARAVAESVSDRKVTVKVVSQVTGHTGGGVALHPYHTKSIFAFQHIEHGEVMLLGMYVHEFGADAPEETAGRVFIECIDSIPIHGAERSDERQKLLTAIVHGYMEYIRDEGFTHVHLRVPPPSAENHHIFTARSLGVRLEATVRMAHWYRRLLECAQEKGIVQDFDLQSHLSKMKNFPPAILPSSDLAEEHSFSTMRSQLSLTIQSGKRTENDVKLFQRLASFKERFCVATLSRDPMHSNQLPVEAFADMTTLLTAHRLTFVLACQRENLSFGTLADAKMSTMLLLARMISDQRDCADYQVGTGSVESAKRGNAQGMQQHEQEISPESLVSFHSEDHDDLPMSHAPAWATDGHNESTRNLYDIRNGNISIDELRWDDVNHGVNSDGLCGDGLDGEDAELFADSMLDV